MPIHSSLMVLDPLEIKFGPAEHSPGREAGQRRQFRVPLAIINFGLTYVHLRKDRRL